MKPDELNPNFLFQSTHTDLLVEIVKGNIDPVKLASRELENRGLNGDGNWVGFSKPSKKG